MLIVDSHVHVVAKNNPKYPQILHHLPMAWIKTHAVDADELVRMQDEAGIHKAVLIQCLAGHGFDNNYTADSALRFPERFVAVGMLDHEAEDAADMLRYWVKERAIRGCRVKYDEADDWRINDPRNVPLWQAAEELRIPMIFFPMELTPTRYRDLCEMLERFPNVKVALDHLAKVDADDDPPFAKEQLLFDLVRYPNLYLKWHPEIFHERTDPIRQRQFFGKLMDSFGADRLMWSSNYPRNHEPDWSLKVLIDTGQKMVSQFSKREQRLLLGESAASLWPELAN